MRPKHNRHPYKGTKFRKISYSCDRSGPNFNLYADWLEKVFLPVYLERGTGNWRWTYKRLRKIYNAWYRQIKTKHKKNGGFLIGDQFWYKKCD
jgi:hypothetical protein